MKTNKPLIALTAVALAAVLTVPGITLAAGNADAGQYGNGQNTAQPSFIDENNDGVCDNWVQGGQQGRGQGTFVDEDGDGICDNRDQAGQQRLGQQGQRGANDEACNGTAQRLRAHDGTGQGMQKRNQQ